MNGASWADAPCKNQWGGGHPCGAGSVDADGSSEYLADFTGSGYGTICHDGNGRGVSCGEGSYQEKCLTDTEFCSGAGNQDGRGFGCGSR